jgi:hypothetical protein
MTADPFARLAAELRAQTQAELREALRGATDPILQKLAVDLVPALFRNDYRGEAAAAGARWAHAFAKPRFTALPTFLVRIHSGPFSPDDAANLRMTMQGANITQAAVAVISDGAMPGGVRALLGAAVPWLLDTDGLVNLMMNANVGVTSRIYETKCVNAAYFGVR